MKFKFLSGDIKSGYDAKFVSKKLNNGDFDYWLVIEVINMDEVDNNPFFKYMVTLYAVSPSEAGKDNVKRALESLGMDENESDNLILVEALTDYGINAQLWNDGGDNLKKMLKEVHKEADIITTLFGFFMDKYENGIGSTGWDMIKGDIDAGLRRYKEEMGG